MSLQDLRTFTRNHVAVVIVGAGTFALAAIVSLLIWHARTEAFEDGRIEAERLVHLHSEQTLRAFQTTDLVLQKFVHLLEHGPPPPGHDEEFRSLLQESVREMPHLRGIFVVDSNGFVIHDTGYGENNAPRNLSDRAYFAAHRDGAGGLRIGRPLVSRAAHQWFVPISRRLNSNDGDFAGVIVGSIEPKYFEEIFRELRLGGDDALGLFDSDAILVARIPHAPDLIGRSWPETRLFKLGLPSTPAGTYYGTSFQGKPVIVSYRRLPAYGLVATVLLDEGDLLANWRRSAYLWSGGAAALIALMLALASLLDRRRQERRAAEVRAFTIHKLETLGQMTSGIAHDFNNMLAIIAASLRRIRNGGPTEEALSVSEQAVERGKCLASQLLEFAKRPSVAAVPQDIDDLLLGLQSMIRQAAGPSCRVRFALNGGGMHCLVDAGQFDVAMLNLVVNAAQSMDEGEITISTEPLTIERMSADGLKPGKYLSVKVSDNGCGIPAKNLDRVLEPFFTTKKDAGTGLGLSQVYMFMHHIHGDVRIESKVQEGTTVELLFPCQQ